MARTRLLKEAAATTCSAAAASWNAVPHEATCMPWVPASLLLCFGSNTINYSESVRM